MGVGVHVWRWYAWVCGDIFVRLFARAACIRVYVGKCVVWVYVFMRESSV